MTLLPLPPVASPESEPAGDGTGQPAAGAAFSDAGLCHRFRHSLRCGGINPLLYLIPAYRSAAKDATCTR